MNTQIKTAVIYDEILPYDGTRPTPQALDDIKSYADILDHTTWQKNNLAKYTTVINLHGKYFPKQIWNSLLEHLKQGKGFINVGGGTPLSVPVSVDTNSAIKVDEEQTAYHEHLNIFHGLSVSSQRYKKLEVNKDIPILSGYEDCFEISDTIGLIVRFTKFKDVPEEEGSAGPMDANIYPLLMGFDENARQSAAPVVMIENTKGEFTGGRWIFVNIAPCKSFWENSKNLLSHLAQYVANPVLECVIRPNYASYFPGEKPAVTVQMQGHYPENKDVKITVAVLKDGDSIYEENLEFSVDDAPIYRTISIPITITEGLYELRATVYSDNASVRTIRNGFWGYDKKLLESASKLTCGRDYFLKNGVPTPIVGMTYMQSDVHRKFLYLPNAYLWDKDMAEMERAGINMVRTGVWTGMRTFAFNDGIISEEFLRILDGLFLTAAKHDIPIVFNFFAFSPDVWEGANPYLDPRSIAAQKRFISSVVSRHTSSRGVSWDLINEPSVCAIRSQWKPQPNYDKFEQKAWCTWLRERHENDISKLQSAWNYTPYELPDFESASLPNDDDLNPSPRFMSPHKPMKSVDYMLFTQEVLCSWIRQMTCAIRAAGSTTTVTVGQDEALAAHRPSPFFYADFIDYTTNHSWWLNDDLYWDGIFAKDEHKPCLIQETGIMYLLTANGKARRNEEELRNLLERKYATAFAANGAGAVQWIWNINTYMDNMNEVNIGAVRPDGSQKVEADVSFDFGRFMKQIGADFINRKQEDVAVIFPYANNFTSRDYALDATQKAARVLGYRLHMPFKAYGEYNLSKMKSAKLIILPCAASLSDCAWAELLSHVTAGSTLLLTGVFSRDEYYHDAKNRRAILGLQTQITMTRREEQLCIDGNFYPVSYGSNQYEWVDKEYVCGSNEDSVHVTNYGRGQIIWSPLPVEVNMNTDVIEALYQFAFDKSEVISPIIVNAANKSGILAKKLSFDNMNLYVCISECGYSQEIQLLDTNLQLSYKFNIPADRAFLFATDAHGNIICSYRNKEVTRDCFI